MLSLLEPAKLVHLLFSLIFAGAVPVAGTLVFARLKGLSFDIPDRSLRATPFMLAAISYSLGTALLLLAQAPALITGLMLAYAVNTTVMLGVTQFWKISIHAAGVAGPLSFLVYRLGLWSSFLYALVVPVGILKLRLKEHSIAQLVVGATLTAAITWIQIIFVVPSIP